MSLELDKPIILANKQVFTFNFVSINNVYGALEATVCWSVTDEHGKQLDPLVQKFTGKDFNNFWIGFNTGTWLYQLLAKEKGLPIPLVNSHESEFINK